jgi:hypothetical protein
MPLFPPVITATLPCKRFMESPVFVGANVQRPGKYELPVFVSKLISATV